MIRSMTDTSQPFTPPDDISALAPLDQARTLLDLAATDRRAAELAFEKLGFDQQLDTALHLTGDQLHEWLMLSTDLTELVRALPPEHLHQAVRLIGEEDALNLLQAASSEQMQQMTDIEWFTENKLDRKKVRIWIELLMQLDEDEADQALQGLDMNALARYLRPVVKPAVDEDNLLLALHLNQRWLFTPDDLNCRDDTARRFLDFIYSVDRDLFGDVLALLIGDDDDITEADMYAGREDRLIKRGFPAMAEAEFLLEMVNASAYGIKWPVLPEHHEAAETTALQVQHRATTPFLLHALAWGRARGDLGERTEREFIKESASLANALLLAHTKDAAKPEHLAEALLSVQVLTSVSLESLSSPAASVVPLSRSSSEGSLVRAVEKLKSMELRELFQLGWSLTREVSRDAWVLSMDEHISEAGLQRNLKWLRPDLRKAVRDAEDLMSWRRIAATAKPAEEGAEAPQELLTWPRLCYLRLAIWQAQAVLDNYPK